MRDSIVNKLLELRKSNDDNKLNLREIMDSIVSSSQFHVFEEVINQTEENFFVKDDLHGISHSQRVCILTMAIAVKEGVSDEELKTLLKAALYHDLGRREAKGREHGVASSRIIEENREKLVPDFSDDQLKMVQFLSSMHNSADEKTKPEDYEREFDYFCQELNIEDKEEAKKLLNIIKDADALDRARLPRYGSLDPERIRTDTAKSLIKTAKDLVIEYRKIQYEQGGVTRTEVFGGLGADVIEDEENFYIFRTLSPENMQDISNPENTSIRTKAATSKTTRRNETENQGVSLEEMFNAIRVAKTGKANKCVSFSSNPNVVLDYTETDDNGYVIYAVPKNNSDVPVYNAIQYMLSEIDKRLTQKVRTSKGMSDELNDIIQQIDNETSTEKIMELVSESYNTLKIRTEGESKLLGEKTADIKSRAQIISRFEQKQMFTPEQQLEYTRVIAKLSVLESHGIVGSLINTQANNSKLIGTLGTAISSGEMIHYGDVPKAKVTQVRKDITEAFALVSQIQQLEGVDISKVNAIKTALLNLVKNRADLTQDRANKQGKTENTTISTMSPMEIMDQLKLKDGRIVPYEKGNTALEFIKNYAAAKIKTHKLIESIKTTPSISETDRAGITELLESVEDSIIIPDPSIIGRRNNQGIQLSGSVNLDMNPNKNNQIFSMDEQTAVINTLNQLSYDELVNVANGNFEAIKARELFENSFKDDNKVKNENDYYIDYIINNIELDQIYTRAGAESKKIETIKGKLRDTLNQIDVKNVYYAFSKSGVNYNDIPNYIVNLVFENGYGEYSLTELAELDNLDNYLTQMKGNLNYRIAPSYIDKYIKDENENIVSGTRIKLREYQQIALDKSREILKNRRFSGVVLPTGAGKSFVSLAQMMDFQNEKIVYFAPRNEILRQFQTHIVKHILGKSILTVEDVDKLQEMTQGERAEFLEDKIYNRGININEQLASISKADASKEELEAMKKIFLPRKTATYDDVMDEIHTVFPHLEMHCYQSLTGNEFEELKKKNVGLYVFDELHRTGAPTWQPLINEMLENNPESKILGVTATPVRDSASYSDIESAEDQQSARDMMLYMARTYGNFTPEEIKEKAYLASEMDIITGMQNRYIIEPKIVSCSFTLRETDQYKHVCETLEAERNVNPDSEVVKTLEAVKSEMDEIINGGSSEITDNLTALRSVFSQYIPAEVNNGKFIVFLPKRPSDYKGTTEEYVQKQIEKINEAFSDVNQDISSGYLLSNREDSGANIEAISTFEDSENGALKLLYAISMLDEGVHVNGINGEVMLRKIGKGSNILYLQQIGRVIYAIDPDNPPKDEEIPLIFDIHNNYLTRDLNRYANSTTPVSDLGNIQIIKNWINNHERVPDINSEENEEARKAIQIKRLQEKYSTYYEKIPEDNSFSMEVPNLASFVRRQNSNLSETESIEIAKILKIGIEIELFDMNIGNRDNQLEEDTLSKVTAFEVKGDIKRFLQCFKQAQKAIKARPESDLYGKRLRIKDTMKILQVIGQYGIEINSTNLGHLEKEIYNKVHDKYSENLYDVYNLTLGDINKELVPEHLRKKILNDLEMTEEEAAEYPLGKDYFYAKSVFYGDVDTKIRDIFQMYDITDIRMSGIISNEYLVRGSFLTDGSIQIMGKPPKIFEGINIYTGTRYDEEGYDIDGYDESGYNRKGIDREGYDREGYNDKGITRYGFQKDGIHKDTGNRLSPDYFDEDGIYWEADPDFPDDVSKRRNTGKTVNKQGINRDKWYCTLNEEGEYVENFSAKYYFDKNGRYWEADPDFPNDLSKRIKTDRIVNPESFDAEGFFYKDGKKTQRKANDDGWDIDHLYHKRTRFW